MQLFVDPGNLLVKRDSTDTAVFGAPAGRTTRVHRSSTPEKSTRFTQNQPIPRYKPSGGTSVIAKQHDTRCMKETVRV